MAPEVNRYVLAGKRQSARREPPVALAFTGRYAKRVSALGHVDTTAWYGLDAPRVWEERAQKALEGGLASLVQFQVTRWFSERSQGQPRSGAEVGDHFSEKLLI